MTAGVSRIHAFRQCDSATERFKTVESKFSWDLMVGLEAVRMKAASMPVQFGVRTAKVFAMNR